MRNDCKVIHLEVIIEIDTIVQIWDLWMET